MVSKTDLNESDCDNDKLKENAKNEKNLEVKGVKAEEEVLISKKSEK